MLIYSSPGFFSMLQRMKRYRGFFAFFTYAVVFTILTTLFIQGNFSNSTIMNFRPQASQERMPEILRSFQEMKVGPKKDIKGDDPGFMFLYILATHLEGNQTISHSTEGKEYSTTYQVFQVLIHLSFIALLLLVPSVLLSYSTKIILLYLLISPNLLAVFWGFDVYLFPLYSGIVSLYCFGNLKQKTLSKPKFLVCSLLVMICEIFRKNSLLVFFPVLGLLVFKKGIPKKDKGIFVGTFLLSLVMLKFLVSLAFLNPGHTVWHSLHAGLFEIGGCVDKKGESYPFIIYDLGSLKKDELVYCSNKWNDVFEYAVADRHGIKDYFSKEYEALLKKQTIAIVMGHPLEMVSFVTMRFMNILSFLPMKTHTRLGSVEETNLGNVFESILFILLFILWFKKEEDREKKFIFLAMLVLSMVPPLLVHSGHLIYNMAANFIQWMILASAGETFLPLIIKKMAHSPSKNS
jgi:hypothetical protein